MPTYNPYNSNMYLQEMQGMRDRIDKTIQNYQQNQNQYMQQQQQQPQIQQTFQLAPNQNNVNDMDGKIANNLDEVKRSLVLKPTIFVTPDYSNIWIKDVSGNIRTFRTEEIIEVDENLVEINDLKREINDLKALLVQQLQPKQQTQQAQNPPQVVENQKSDKKNK